MSVLPASRWVVTSSRSLLTAMRGRGWGRVINVASAPAGVPDRTAAAETDEPGASLLAATAVADTHELNDAGHVGTQPAVR